MTLKSKGYQNDLKSMNESTDMLKFRISLSLNVYGIGSKFENVQDASDSNSEVKEENEE